MEKRKFKETILYTKNPPNKKGEVILTGKSVNFPACVASAAREEELKEKMTEMLRSHLTWSLEELSGEDVVELKYVENPEEFLHEPNITYWELDRMRHIMKRPEVQEVWKKIIVEQIDNVYNEADGSIVLSMVWREAADRIINTFIESKTE